MRFPLVLAATLALTVSACKNNDQTDKTQNYDENLTAQNIVSNDVTAIDAVTGDAANMAADVDTNYGNLDMNGPEPKPTGKKPSSTDNSAPRTSTAAAANTTTNAVANGD